MSDNDPISETRAAVESMRAKGRSAVRAAWKIGLTFAAVAVGVALLPAPEAKATAVAMFVVFGATVVYVTLDWSRRDLPKMVDQLLQIGSSACRERGICGNAERSLSDGRYGPAELLICDLQAGHTGWHGCQVPGLPERTSWTRQGVEP